MGTELDRVRGAGLGAGRLQSVLESVVTERALTGASVLWVAVDHAERTRGHAVAAAVAHVRLEHHRLMLGPDQRTGGARVETARVRAVPAHVRHEHPIAHLAHRLGDVHEARGGLRTIHEVDGAGGRDCRQAAPSARVKGAPGLLPELRRGLEQLDEPDVPPGRRGEISRVVIGDALAGLRAVRGQVVPLLAGNLAGLAADAHGRIGEESQPRHFCLARHVDGDLGVRGARAGVSAGGHPLFSCGSSADGSSWSGRT